MNWQKHDRALFVAVTGKTDYPYLYGQNCELIFFIGSHKGMSRTWVCDFDGQEIKVNERCLRPIPDNQISSWDELEKIIDWNPKVTV